MSESAAWQAGYMQGWRDYPSAMWRGFYPPTEEAMTLTDEYAATYEDPATGLTFTLQNEFIGNTYDPPNGADFWHCPLCGRQRCDRRYDGFRGNYAALRRHLDEEHNVRVTEQRIEITIGRLFDDRGLVVRYVDDRAGNLASANPNRTNVTTP